MKTLEELFAKIHKVYPHQLVLLKNNQRILSTDDEDKNNNLQIEGEYIYPLKIQAAEEYQLQSSKVIAKETLGLIELLINLYLEEIQSLNKREVLQHLAVGNINEENIKKINIDYFKKKGTYQLIWIVGPSGEDTTELVEMLEECFKTEEKLTVVPIDEGVFLLIETERAKEELLATAKIIRDMVNAELFLDVYISISKTFSRLHDLQQKLEQLKETIAIGKFFSIKSHIYFEDDLNLEKTILAIPQTKREKFYWNYYHTPGFDKIDEEAHLTIETFLKNNLNLGDTSKELFIHRNTLVYRLDRISKQMGLDLRKFEDAVFYKIAMLIKKSIE